MKIKKDLLFSNQSEKIILYTLCTIQNLEVQILSWGASLYKILLTFSLGQRKNVVLTLHNPKDYVSNKIYAGATLGPVAGRIEQAKLPIDDKIYELTQNDGMHNLHGGRNSISHMNWKEHSFVVSNNTATLTLSCSIPDMLDGYPGNRSIFATYTLEESGRLTLYYRAISDSDTYFNLSNHAYFNLSGNFLMSGLAQRVQSPANFYTCNGNEHICYGMESVKNSPFDFHVSKSLQENMDVYKDFEQLKTARGYNHGLVISKNGQNMIRHALTMSDAENLHTLSLYTDAPCVVLYSGGFIEESIVLEGNVKGTPSCAIALEAQDFPNAPWVNSFPYCPPKKEMYMKEQ